MTARPLGLKLESCPTVSSMLRKAGLDPGVLVDVHQHAIAVRFGVPRTLRIVALDGLDLPQAPMAQILNEKANSRGSDLDKTMPQADGQALLDAFVLFAETEALFESWDSAKGWLVSPVPALGGLAPIAKMADIEGREAVRITLRKIHFGDFS